MSTSKFSKFLKKGRSVGVKASAATALEAAAVDDVDAAAELLAQLKKQEPVGEWGADDSDDEAVVPLSTHQPSHFASLVSGNASTARTKPKSWQATKPEADGADEKRVSVPTADGEEVPAALATPPPEPQPVPAHGDAPTLEPTILGRGARAGTRRGFAQAQVDVKSKQQFPELGQATDKNAAVVNAWGVKAKQQQQPIVGIKMAGSTAVPLSSSSGIPAATAPPAPVLKKEELQEGEEPSKDVVSLDDLFSQLKPVECKFTMNSALAAAKYKSKKVV